MSKQKNKKVTFDQVFDKDYSKIAAVDVRSHWTVKDLDLSMDSYHVSKKPYLGGWIRILSIGDNCTMLVDSYEIYRNKQG